MSAEPGYDLPEHDGSTCPYPDDFCTHECVCGVAPELPCLLHPAGPYTEQETTK